VPLLLVDLDNTLIDREACFRRWADDFAEEHSLAAGARTWLVEADGDGYVPRAEFFAAARARFGLVPTAEELVDGYGRDYAERTVPPGPEAMRQLATLRERGWRIGLVTNGNARQYRKLEVAGLGPQLDGVCVSELEGVAKPDAAIFRLAAERCGMPLEGAWMVGDHPEYDIAGAARLGLSTIWLRRGRMWALAEVEPTHTVDSLEEALGLLLELG
jgi:putative hydrolase of the HAD superfamily